MTCWCSEPQLITYTETTVSQVTCTTSQGNCL